MTIAAADPHIVTPVTDNIGIAKQIVGVITRHGIVTYSDSEVRACGVRSTPGYAITVTVILVILVHGKL
jgi:hypothetical protein